MELFQKDKSVLKNILNSFNKSEEQLETDTKNIKEWIKTQHHFPELMDEAKIRNFLLLNKCNPEKTKEKIEMYYIMKSVIPEIYNELNPKLDIFKQFKDTFHMCVHPKLYQGKYRIVLMKLKTPDSWIPQANFARFLHISEVRLQEDLMSEDVFVFDAINLTVKDVNSFPPSLMAKCLAIMDEIYNMPIHQVHFINIPPYFEPLKVAIKSIAQPEVYARYNFHNDDQVIRELFTESELPKDYGGKGPSLEELSDLMEKKIVEHQKRFDDLDKMKVDEDLRPKKLDYEEILGYYAKFMDIHTISDLGKVVTL